MRATRAETVARMQRRGGPGRASRALKTSKREADGAKDRAEKRSDELAALNEKLRHLNYVADINLARHAWDQNNVALVGELLERHRPKPGETDLRGFEWHYLRRLPHRDLLTVKAHAEFVRTVAWTPDGKRLVSLGTTTDAKTSRSFVGESKLWDAATLTSRTLQLKGKTDKIHRGVISPDGKLLAAGCDDKTARVWNLETGELIATLVHTVGYTPTVAFNSDGTRLLSLVLPLNEDSPSASAEMRIWDRHTRKAIVTIDKLPPSRSMAFSPDGNA